MFTCSKDKTVKYWDADHFDKILTLKGHQSEVRRCDRRKTASRPSAPVSLHEDNESSFVCVRLCGCMESRLRYVWTRDLFCADALEAALCMPAHHPCSAELCVVNVVTFCLPGEVDCLLVCLSTCLLYLICSAGVRV